MNVELGNSGTTRRPVSAGSVRGRPARGMIRAKFIAMLVVLDLITIIGGFSATHVIIGRGSSDTQWLYDLIAIIPIYIVVAINAGAYDVESLGSRFTAAKNGARALLITASAIVLVAFCLKVSTNFSRMTLLIGVTGSVIVLVVTRYVFVGRAFKILGGEPFVTIFLVDSDDVIPPDDHLVMPASIYRLDPDSHDPHMYDRLATVLKSADRVIVTCAPNRRQSWTRALKGANILSEIVIPELSELAPLGQGWHGLLPTIVVAKGPLRLSDRLIKRCFDVAVSSLALVALLPILIIISLVIKLDSPGPIFFVQTRIGRGNAQFRLLKFRSMRHEEADSQGLKSTARDDDRITRVGRVLRSASLDELPQLINIIKGDMSVVGPRPHALGSRAADKLFWEIDERYWHRHAAKPGLTGLAQIRGYRGATHEESDLVNRLQADLEYLDQWSIRKDIWILFLTLRVLLHPNAY